MQTPMHAHPPAYTPLTHIPPITHTHICPFIYRLLYTPLKHFFTSRNANLPLSTL